VGVRAVSSRADLVDDGYPCPVINALVFGIRAPMVITVLVDDGYLFPQLDDGSPEGSTDAKRAMSMLRMGRSSADEAAVKKAMGMLRMGRASGNRLIAGMPFADDEIAPSKRKMSMLRMGRAMGMLRMGRAAAAAGDNEKRAMSMLRMG